MIRALRQTARLLVFFGVASTAGVFCLDMAVAQNLSPGRYMVRVGVSDGIQNLRSGPDVTFSIIVAIPAGATDVVINGGCRAPSEGKSRYPWCQASWRGRSGWISSCCLTPHTITATTASPLPTRSLASLETTVTIAFEFARDRVDRARATRIAEQVANARNACGDREDCIREVLLAAIGDYQRIARAHF